MGSNWICKWITLPSTRPGFLSVLLGAQFKPLDLDLPLMYQSYLQQNPALS